MPKFIFNTKDITTSKSELILYTDSYWLCINGDTTKALFFGDSPQCNRNIKVMEWAIKREMYKNYSKDLEIVFVEIAFVPERI